MRIPIVIFSKGKGFINRGSGVPTSPAKKVENDEMP